MEEKKLSQQDINDLLRSLDGNPPDKKLHPFYHQGDKIKGAVSKELLESILTWIDNHENLGEHGSGHMGYTTYTLKEVADPTITKAGKQVIFTYTKFTETEFTYYPDNPPYESTYRVTVIVDDQDRIISDSNKEEIAHNRFMDFDTLIDPDE